MSIKRKKAPWLVITFIAILLSPPLAMYFIWIFKTEKQIDIIMVDKTVANMQKSEHASLHWLLHNLKVTKHDKSLYSIDDYYGFFPENDEKFTIVDFEKADTAQLQQLVEKNQLLYITDTYGVYANEWYNHKQISERSGKIYGGLTEREMELLKGFKKSKQLIITEFNCIGSPTTTNIRKDFENTFAIKWTGWVGRYFENLLESNSDVPQWLVKNYKAQHNNAWPFKNSGIAFVKDDDQVEILDETNDLTTDIPVIHTNEIYAKKYNLPKSIPYAFWFDIMELHLPNNQNKMVSYYHINTTTHGDSILKSKGIPNVFPAVTEHYQTDYKFYYFSGDFADNTISKKLSHLEGIPFIKANLTSLNDRDREKFYWNFYYPLMSEILTEYHSELAKAAK